MPYRKLPTAHYESLSSREPLYRNFSVQFSSSNPWGFPDILPWEGELPERLIPYNDVTRYDRQELTAVHFFLTDNRFERCWSDPATVLYRLQDVGMALGPDFSMFTDWPVAVQMYNKYRSHWCCAFWQKEGLPVIPTVMWSTEDSFEWCFEGLPRESPLALSAHGCLKDPAARRLFVQGFRCMMEKLSPTVVLSYGTLPREIRGLVDTVKYPLKFLVHRRDENGKQR